jgi:xanthine dehydrogenase accessory factor
MTDLINTICLGWLDADVPFILVALSDAMGSAPRDAGAILAVCADDSSGSIGGGRLEWEAILEARRMLANGSISQTLEITLGPDLGQCCGGRVTLVYERGTASLVQRLDVSETYALQARPVVHIYGAGHVGRALANALAHLPLAVILIDSREAELNRAATSSVKKLLTDDPVSIAEKSSPDAAHVVLTHSHSLDSLIAVAILEKCQFSYLGIIGSRTKRATFRKAFRAMGIAQEHIDRVVCPIGSSRVNDKRPEIIAALTAAEIVGAVFGKEIGG